ncbi:carbohydrate kinase [Massilia sp. CCM 8733]|uniref:Carbohydrate kinase n=1 Tax=Massilia mucilaginosa TaxID=2609282 RepID=A0ABX0NXP8_9BURK|nr:PfkB family carbohydrate kinase [Massilia mucilaginosa]NHZ91504.1 carbohydrate kinase [Massilia mucilaginosa]
MIVTFGEALVDMIQMPDGRFAAALGGSVCNFTLAAARQSLALTYLNPLSQDAFGQGFADLLERAGVTLGSRQRSACPTSLAIVTLDADKTPSYAFHRQGVADRDITPRQACAALPQGARLFHTGGLTLVPDDLDTTLTLILAARDTGALISIDANMRPLACADLPRYAAGVRAVLRHADLIKVSEEDLVHLGFGGRDPLALASALFDTLPVRLIALTLGAQGAVLLTRTASASIATPPGLAVVDTVGCGDCFLAGLVASLGNQGLLSAEALDSVAGPALERAGRYAVAAASLNATREGCNPPAAAEVAAFLRERWCG